MSICFLFLFLLFNLEDLRHSPNINCLFGYSSYNLSAPKKKEKMGVKSKVGIVGSGQGPRY